MSYSNKTKVTSKELESVLSRLQEEKDIFVKKQATPRLDNEIEPRRLSHPNARIPKLIDWQTRCPNLLWNFSAKPQPLPVVPPVSQESAVVADLLHVLVGVSGGYIYPNKFTGKFHIEDRLESSFRQLAKSILPLAEAFSSVSKFIEERRACKYGMVNHALSASLDSLCLDYLAFMARLSSQHRTSNLNLQVLYSEVQPYVYLFQTLSDMCSKIDRDCRGGRTLTILREAVRVSSGKAERLLQHLLETSAVPYMKQLQIWLTQGVVYDIYFEFLIEDHQLIVTKELPPEDYSENYWQKRYTICKERCPDFLQMLSETVLRTGKYLNVLRQCEVSYSSLTIPTLKYSCTENTYSESIRQAHRQASCSLLKHLMVDTDLPGHLRSVRNYLFLAQGDFVTKFMDMAEPELNKEIMDIVPSRLQSLLELALRTSSANSDPYKDLLRVELNQETVLTQLNKITHGRESVQNTDPGSVKGWEAVTFVYIPPWPVSLVLNYSALTIYQLIFRHLVYCRYVERRLCRIWLDHKKSELWAAWDLRQRMLLYVNNLQYYMLVDVIEPQWNRLLAQLPSLRDLDEVLDCNTAFRSDCLVKCMLANPQHFKVVNTFLRKCIEFCHFMDACGLVEASPKHAPNAPPVAFTKSESFSTKILEFNLCFTEHVNYLFKTLRNSDSEDKITDVLYRLDFNSFYKTSVVDRRKHRSGESISSSSTSD